MGWTKREAYVKGGSLGDIRIG